MHSFQAQIHIYILRFKTFSLNQKSFKSSTHQDKWRGFKLITRLTRQVWLYSIFVLRRRVVRETKEKEREGKKVFPLENVKKSNKLITIFIILSINLTLSNWSENVISTVRTYQSITKKATKCLPNINRYICDFFKLTYSWTC